jgi:hypothetical protein
MTPLLTFGLTILQLFEVRADGATFFLDRSLKLFCLLA